MCIFALRSFAFLNSAFTRFILLFTLRDGQRHRRCCCSASVSANVDVAVAVAFCYFITRSLGHMSEFSRLSLCHFTLHYVTLLYLASATAASATAAVAAATSAAAATACSATSSSRFLSLLCRRRHVCVSVCCVWFSSLLFWFPATFVGFYLLSSCFCCCCRSNRNAFVFIILSLPIYRRTHCEHLKYCKYLNIL